MAVTILYFCEECVKMIAMHRREGVSPYAALWSIRVLLFSRRSDGYIDGLIVQ